MTVESAAQAMRLAIQSARQGLVEREALVELVVLCAIASEHLLVIGPPGTAKSEAIRRVSAALGGRTFEYLLGRFTEPGEIFGPVDLRRLREGVIETQTAGMLPEAEIAFLDEVFLGSTAILNTLLGILNERVYRRGHTTLACPLRLCVGAANELPEEGSLAAFADRFLVRVFVEEVADDMLEELLERGWSQPPASGPAPASIEDVDVLAEAARSCDLSGIRGELARAIRLMREAGVSLSDRRVVKTQQLIAAAATLDGRTEATTADLWPLIYVAPTQREQDLARDALAELLANSDNASMAYAAEDASRARSARATALLERAREVLSADDDPDRRLRLESLLRDLDAGFSPTHQIGELKELRASLTAALSKDAS